MPVQSPPDRGDRPPATRSIAVHGPSKRPGVEPSKAKAKPETKATKTTKPKLSARAAKVAPKRKTGQWKHLPSAADLRDRKTGMLYHQAALAFHQKGYAATSLSDIAERLGISKAALYHYVGNKQELLMACHIVASDAADDTLAQVPEAATSGMTGLQRLRMGLRCYLESILSESSASVVALEEAALTPENFRIVAARRDRFQNCFTGYILAGIEDGSIVRCDPKLATFGVLGGVNWVEKWYRAGGPWTPNQIATAMSEMMVRTLAARPRPLRDRVVDYPDMSALDEMRLKACNAPARARKPATRVRG